MLIKFDFSSKKGVVVVKFAFATAILKIETLRMRRRFARVLISGVDETNSVNNETNRNNDSTTRNANLVSVLTS